MEGASVLRKFATPGLISNRQPARAERDWVALFGLCAAIAMAGVLVSMALARKKEWTREASTRQCEAGAPLCGYAEADGI